MAIDHTALTRANAVMTMIVRHQKFEARGNDLYVVDTRDGTRKRASFRHDLYFQFNLWRFGWGGTCEVSVVMLARWIKGMNRFPVRFFLQSWGEKTHQTLVNLGYEDPEKVCCVLCKEPVHRGRDWWHGKKGEPNGPCCQDGNCEKAKAEWEADQAAREKEQA